MTSRLTLLVGLVSAFLSVAFGAFGAHALKERLSEYSLGVYQTGVHYQSIHALALIALALWMQQVTKSESTLGIWFTAGILLFSGSLYLLALTGVKMWGAVTPLGGLCFLIAWAIWIYQVARA